LHIEKFGALRAFGNPETKEQVVKKQRLAYQAVVNDLGENSSLDQGIHLLKVLYKANCAVEAWRLLKRLITISQQHHGREHGTTIFLENTLPEFHTHVVKLKSLGLKFRVIGYEEDKYILRGPTSVPQERRQILRVCPADA
jgi:hypothetical protein